MRMCMCHPKCASLVSHFGGARLTVSIRTGASNGRCGDAMTLPIGDWLLFRRRDIPPYCALHFLPFKTIRVTRLVLFYSL